MTPKRRIIPVFVPHLGCPNNCVFCNQRRISGKCEPATAETVISAVRAVGDSVDSFEGYELAFYGGSFTAIPEKEQCQLLNAASDFVSSGGILRLSTRPDCITAEILDRLKNAGVKTIELGCQSMDDEVLLKSGRGHKAEDAEKAAKLIKSYGFDLILQMMTGLPGDSLEKSIETARRLISLHPDGVRIYPTVIIRDTPLFDMWQRGEYKEHTVSEAVEWCSELLPLFDEQGIPVIRLGLNPSDELSEGSAAAGAYHPAFGELVYSRIYLNKALKLLKSSDVCKTPVLCVNPGCVSFMSGHKKQNIAALKKEFGFESVKIIGDNSLKKGEIRLLCVEK